MISKCAIVFLLCVQVAAVAAPACARAPEPDDSTRADGLLSGLDAYAERAMESWDAPGMALVVVRDDSVLTRSYGVKTLGTDDPVDDDTLFAIGSLTKAFTATLLAMLVDEGKISWDDPVVRHLPDFEMYDPYVTEHLTIRDVLAHRSGLAGNDLIWAAGGTSPAELIHRLRFQEPAFGFRARLGYHNAMYVVAGEVAAAIEGKPWDVLVRQRIFAPLGMQRSTTGSKELRERANVALPHDEIGPGQLLGTSPSPRVPLEAPTTVRRVGWFDSATPPAGDIASSVAEFGRWLRFQLGAGQVDGERLLGEKALIATRTPQILFPGFPRSQSESSETNLGTYGMGWGVRDYRGRLMVSHLGSTPGWGSAVALLPAERSGVAVFVNYGQGLWLANSVTRWILDRLLEAEEKDWNEEALSRAEERRNAGKAALEKAAVARIPGTRPSLPLEAYAGTYVDELYPSARVTLKDGKLRFVLGPMLAGDLDHWQDDTFRVTWEREELGANLVTFHVADGDHAAGVESRIMGQNATWRRCGKPTECDKGAASLADRPAEDAAGTNP